MTRIKNVKRLKIIWQFGKKYLPLFIIAELCIVVSYTVTLLLPLNLTTLTDKVLYNGQHGLLLDVVRNYLILFLIATVFNLLYAFVWQTLDNRFVVDVKNAVYEKVIFAKASILSNMNCGDIMSRIDWDCEQFIFIVQRNFFHFINSLLLCGGIIYLVANINLIIALLLVLAALIPIVATRLGGKINERISRESRHISGTFSGRIFEILKGFREIKILKAKSWANKQFFDPLKKLIILGNNSRRIDFLVDKGINFFNLSVLIIIYGYSTYLIINNKLTIGLFLAIILYIAILHKKFNWMLRIYLDWFARRISIERVIEILECENENDIGGHISEIKKIEFKNIIFGYDKNSIMENISFEIEKGERVAIVGASGVGKTTLIGLLMKFYEPNSGEILINGLNSNVIKYSDIRRNIGIVSQDIILFDETIRYNLMLGDHHSDSDLFGVLKRVGLLEIIQNLPEGLDTKLSAAKNGMSGGQKQRLMLARLFLRKTPIIILDEATSALDIETESKISNELMSTSFVSTIIVISHRFESIKNCSKIIVINDGKIEMIGSHDELRNRSSSYNIMFPENLDEVVSI